MVFFEMLLERNNVYNHMIYLTDNYAQNSHFFFFFQPWIDFLVQSCMDSAHLDLQLGLWLNASAEETKTWSRT